MSDVEKMRLEIDVETRRAVQSMLELASTLRLGGGEFDSLKKSVGDTDKAMDDLSDAAKAATRATKDGADAANTAAAAEGKHAQAAKETSRVVRTASEEMTQARRRNIASMSEESTAFSASMSSVAQVATRTLNIVRNIVSEIDASVKQDIRGQVDSTNQLVQQKVAFDRALNDIVSNLNLPGGEPGKAQARQFVSEFAMKTGSKNVDVSSQIVSQAISAGINVGDRSAGGGFDMAALVGLTATRWGLDPESAGNLFKQWKKAGGKDIGDMKQMLAWWEAASRNAAIATPREFMKSGAVSTLNRMDMGVDPKLAIASLIAAAPGEADASRAAENVRIMSRVASGTDEQKQAELARYAAARGLLTEKQISNMKLPLGEGETYDKERSGIANRRRQLQLTAKSFDELDEKDETDEKAEDLAIRADRLELRKMHGPEKAIRSKQIDLREAEYKRKRAADATTRELRRADNAADIERVDQQESVMIRREHDAKAALAYQSLPQQVKEQLLYDITAGMSREQIMAFLNRIAGADQANLIAGQFLPAGREARKVGLADISKATPKMLDDLNKAYLTDSGFIQDVASARAGAANLAAISAGGTSAAALEMEVSESIKRQKSRGEIHTGWYNNAASGLNILGEDETGKSRNQEANDESGILAIQLASATYDRLVRFWNAMSPAQRAKYPGLLNAIKTVRGNIPTIESWANSYREASASRAILFARRMATDVESMIAQVQEEEGGTIRPRNVLEPVPAIRNNTIKSKSIEGEVVPLPLDSPADIEPLSAQPPVSSPEELPATTQPVGPQSSAAPAGHVTNIYHYTQNNGQYFAASSDHMEFQGRLEEA